MYEIKLYHEKDGEIITSEMNNKPITDETLDFALVQFISNFGFDVLEVKKEGKILSQEEIENITSIHGSSKNYKEMDQYFFAN